MQVTGLFLLLPVCTQARGDGEIQREEVVCGLTALTNQLNISHQTQSPETRATVSASKEGLLRDSSNLFLC